MSSPKDFLNVMALGLVLTVIPTSIAEPFNEMKVFAEGKAVAPSPSASKHTKHQIASSQRGESKQRKQKSDIVKEMWNPLLIEISELPEADYTTNTIDASILNLKHGKHVKSMAVNSTGSVYILTSHLLSGKGSWKSRQSSYNQLYRHVAGSDSITLYISDFPGSGKIVFDEQDNLWTYSPLTLFKYDTDRSTYTEVLNVGDCSNSTIHDLAIDTSNNVWISGDHFGLYRITPSGEVTQYTKENTHLSTDDIYRIACSPAGDVWVLCRQRNEIGRFHNKIWDQPIQIPDKPYVLDMRTIACNFEGALWVGAFTPSCFAPLYRHHDNLWQAIKMPHLTHNRQPLNIRTILPIGKEMWTSTSIGLGCHHKRCVDVFDGQKWYQPPGLHRADRPATLAVDHSREIVWVVSSLSGKKLLHRYPLK